MQQAEYFVHQSSFKVCYALFGILTLGYSVTGMLILSPMTVAPVCQVGDPLQITCTASVEYISWSIFHVNEQGTLEKEFNDEIINSIDLNQMTQTRVNSALFTFTRTSAQFASPLISTFSIDSVNSDLNGTVVNCVDTRNMTTSASTTIQIIDTSQNIQYTPTLGISEEHYEADNVTVTVEWIQQQGVTYIVEVSPFVPKTSLIESARYQLTIPYNSTYNLSVVATTPCRPNATAFITLNYEGNSVPTVVGLKGNTAMFSCPPGLTLTGPNSATCTENGEWEPDPHLLTCTEETTSASNEGHTTNLNQKIGISAAVGVTLIMIVLIVAAIFYRKGFKNKKAHTECLQGEQVTTKDLDQDKQHQPRSLAYVDVSVASKDKKRKKQTLTHTQTHDFDVQYSAISHDLTVHNKHEVQATEDDNLDVTLDNLLALLWEQVGPKWREFGEAVGIDEMVLDSIATTCSPENYYVELLDYWLKYYDGMPTWSNVANALYEIDLPKLAQDIEHVHETGKPPSETQDTYINVTNIPPVFKQASAKASQLPASTVINQDISPFAPLNESDYNRHHKGIPPATASKPKLGIHLDTPMQVHINKNF